MESKFIDYFFAGRVYQYYLDNEEDLVSGKIKELGFLVAKKEGLNIANLKKLVKALVEKDGIIIKCSALPKKNGWRFRFTAVS